jgi:hypothetical protein
MLRGCSIAWMLLTMSLASREGDHVPAESDAVRARASISVTLTPGFLSGMADRDRHSPKLFISSY